MDAHSAHADLPENYAENHGGPSVKTEVFVEAFGWRQAVRDLERLVERAVRAADRYDGRLSGAPPTVTFSDDRRIRQLNARFRGRNKPTNVLTFEPLSPYHGGDIVLALETMKREAQASNRSLRAHSAHLLIHGLLHLAGHDHHHPGEARRMENRETRIMRALGFADPWKQANRRSS